tara:strand:+ start:750 stop:1121 length:372 start_codon:yes stop_codon:yes gene_type:complete
MEKTLIESRGKFLNEILPSNKSWIIIKLGAEWCGPCNKIKSLVESLVEKLPESVQFYDLCVDDNMDLYSFFKFKKMVKGIPAILAFECGNTSGIPDLSVVGANLDEISSFFDEINKKTNKIKL